MNKADLIAQVISFRMRSGQLPGERRFPSAREIAETYGVSKVVALQALRRLEDSGRVTPTTPGRRRRSIVGVSEALPRPEDAFPTPLYNRIADRLRTEILAGEYLAAGRLPGMKALCARFGCHASTAARAMAVLEREGLVTRRYRSWILALAERSTTPGNETIPGKAGRVRPPGDRSRPRIYLAGFPKLVATQQPLHLDFIRGLESELESLGWGGLRTYLTYLPEAEPPEPSAVAGYVYGSYGQEPAWNRFFEAHRHLPLAVVDLTEQPQVGLKHPRHLMLRPDNRRAGREMGLHLRGLGHRSALYFTHIPDKMAWSRLRYEGLRQAFPGPFPDGSGSGGVRKIQVEFPAGNPAGPLLPRFTDRELRGLFPEVFLNRHRSMQTELESMTRMAQAALPAFEEAWAAPNRATAWVCANDNLALAALRFLESKGSPAPQAVSVAGFDNLPFDYPLGLTTYDFGFGRFGHLAVRYLVEGKAPLGVRDRVFRVPGRVVARGTTGAPLA